MAGSRAAAEALNTGYTPTELTFGHAVKEKIKQMVTPDKDSTVDKIEKKNKKTKEVIDRE